MTRWRKHSRSSSWLLPARVSPRQQPPPDHGGPARHRLRPRRVGHPSQPKGLRLARREEHQVPRRQPHPALTVNPISLPLVRRTSSGRGLVLKECRSNRLVGCPQRWSRPTTQPTSRIRGRDRTARPQSTDEPRVSASRAMQVGMVEAAGRSHSQLGAKRPNAATGLKGCVISAPVTPRGSSPAAEHHISQAAWTRVRSGRLDLTQPAVPSAWFVSHTTCDVRFRLLPATAHPQPATRSGLPRVW